MEKTCAFIKSFSFCKNKNFYLRIIIGRMKFRLLLNVALVVAASASSASDLSHVSALVTGAAGFLGSQILIALAKRGSKQLRAIDSFNADYSIARKRERSDWIKVSTAVRVLEGDACNSTTLHAIIKRAKITHIIHMVRHDDQDEAEKCLQEVISAAKRSRLSIQHSVIEVLYATPASFTSNRTRSIVEHSAVTTTEFKLPVVYGPGDRPGQFIYVLANNLLYGSGLKVQEPMKSEYVFIDDVVRGILSVVAEKQLKPRRNQQKVYAVRNAAVASAAEIQSILAQLISKPADIDHGSDTLTPVRQKVNHLIEIDAPTKLFDGLGAFTRNFLAREKRLTPCLSECSSKFACFKDSWDTAAQISQELTKKCYIVHYTLATQETIYKLYPASQSSRGCNIVFLNTNSVLYKTVKDSSGSDSPLSYKNWTLVPLNIEFNSFYKDVRKPSRLPKLNPTKFFAPSVRYALYADTSIELLESPQQIVKEMMPDRPGIDIVMAAVQHPELRKNVFDEVQAVVEALKGRPHVTYYPTKILEQNKAYESYMQKINGLRYDNVFDGSLLLYDLQMLRGKEFRCRWYREYQEWSDRDQLSGSHVLSIMNHEYNSTIAGSQAEWIAIGYHGNKSAYVRILPAVYHPRTIRTNNKLAESSGKIDSAKPMNFYLKKEFV